MQVLLSGKAFVFGKNIDTDRIYPSRFVEFTDVDEIKKYAMYGIDPEFAKKFGKGDIIVAGTNFGCGSSREHAPIAIKGAGCSCVIAASYARIFFRNAINVGLPIFECPEAAASIETGDEIEVDPGAGTIVNKTKGKTFTVAPFSPFLQDLIQQGGLIPYVSKELARRKGA